jgi:hypothetical protein
MEKIDIILKLIPLLGFIPFLKAIWEYIKDIKWKKSEFLAKEIKDFQNNDNVKIVFQLLDWNSRKIKLKCGERTISDLDLVSALQTHDVKNKFPIHEAELRDVFDDFFDRLSTFNIYLKNGLISEKELYLYIGYYTNILTSSKRKPEIVSKTLKNYLVYYEFTGVLDLIQRFKNQNTME